MEKININDPEWSLVRPETMSEGWPPGRCRAWQTTSTHPAASHSPWEANSWKLQQNCAEIGVFSLLPSAWHSVNLQCCQNQQDSQVHLDHHVNVVLSEKDNNLTIRKYFRNKFHFWTQYKYPVSPDYKKQRRGQKLSEEISNQWFLQEKFYDKSSKVPYICSTVVDTNNSVKLQYLWP